MTPEGGAEPAWREGYRILRERVGSLPAALRTAAEARPVLDLDLTAIRGSSYVVTGLGSSAAHARYLARLLVDAGFDARFSPLRALGSGSGPKPAPVTLIVFSQGLSPNGRLAFAALDRFQAAILLCAVDEPASGAVPSDKQELIDRLRGHGVRTLPLVGAEEYGTLIRIVGPMTGYVSALRLAEALGAGPFHLDVEAVSAAVAGAADRLDREHADVRAADLEANLSLLASGTYADCVENLRFKVLEGMLLPMPPVWDPLDVVHGPLQQAHAQAATFIALERPDSDGEAELLDGLAAMLVPGRHRLIRLRATLPGALAVFEHEALMNALLLRFVAERQIDQVDWPGIPESAEF